MLQPSAIESMVDLWLASGARDPRLDPHLGEENFCVGTHFP